MLWLTDVDNDSGSSIKKRWGYGLAWLNPKMDLPNTEYDQFGCHTPIFNQLAIYAMVIQVATSGNSHIKLYFWVDDHSFILKQREFNHGISYRYINVLWCYNSYIYIYTYIAYHLHWFCFLPHTKTSIKGNWKTEILSFASWDVGRPPCWQSRRQISTPSGPRCTMISWCRMPFELIS